MDVVDILLATNRIMEDVLFSVAGTLKGKKDNRWFFAFAHASITKRINKGIRLFVKPAELLVFNMNFAMRFLKALKAQEQEAVPPHWKSAFDFCSGWGVVKRAGQLSLDTLKRAQEGSKEDVAVISPMLGCAQGMAEAHINVDIRAALKDVECRVSNADFGNMLYYVEEGAKDALKEAYGETGGLIASTAKEMARRLEKEWRNAVFKSVCGQEVPEPDPDFILKSWKLDEATPPVPAAVPAR